MSSFANKALNDLKKLRNEAKRNGAILILNKATPCVYQAGLAPVEGVA